VTPIVRAAGALWAEAAQLLWPARCAGCNAYIPDAAMFCAACAPSVTPLPPACPGCALPHGPAAPPAGRCATCRRVPFPFVEATAVFEYGEAVADAIVRMKHGARRDLGPRLARALAAPLAQALARGGIGAADLVVPVPLHARKLRRRGFNQALELARFALRPLARRGGGPRLARRLLLRIRDTPELGHAGPAARLVAVAGAFAVAGADAARVRGRRVLVVDDVMTTGATFTACAGALLAAGAHDVRVIALARAV
jgi:ComF family protein